MTNTVVITGGSGFIGKAVCRELEKQQDVPIVVDHSVGIDVRSGEAAELIESSDAVIHLAGVLGTEELFDDPHEAIDTNIKGTVSVLQACSKNRTSYVGITMPQVWDNVYQATKLAAMQMASAWHRHFDVPVCHVRAFNVFGEGQKVGRPQKIVPTFSSYAWEGRPLPVWGDGSQMVDLIYVDQVAQVMVEAMKYGDNRIIDAGTSQGLSVKDVATLVNQVTRNRAGLTHLPMRRGEHGHGVVSEGEGWDVLGWTPYFNVFDLRRTIESYKAK